MLKRLSYRSDLLNDLRSDIGYAAKYLSAALADSQEAFLVALRDVAEANKVAHVAEEANLSRESLYRTLSKEGNPRFSTLDSVLDALGMTLAVQLKHTAPTQSALSTKRGVPTEATPFAPGAGTITITSTPAILHSITAAGDTLILTTLTSAPEPSGLANVGTFPLGFVESVTGTTEQSSIYAPGD